MSISKRNASTNQSAGIINQSVRRMRKIPLLCSLLVIMLAIGVSSANASRTAQFQHVFLPFIHTEARFEWSNETISEDGQFPSLALDAAEQPHVAFVGADGSLQYASRDGATWNVATVDAGSGTNAPVLRFDPAGSAHIAYVQGGALKYASLTGNTWTTETLGTTTDISVDLAFNADGVPYVVNGAMYMYQEEGSWVTASLPDERSSETQIAFGTDSTMHFVYKTYDEATMTSVVDYATYYYSTWTVERVTSYTYPGYPIDFVLDRANVPHIVTIYTCGRCPIIANYVTKAESGWTRRVFAENQELYLPSLAVDGQSVPHIAYTSRSGARYVQLRDEEEAAFPPFTEEQPYGISLALTADDVPLVSYSLFEGSLMLATLVEVEAP